MTSRLNIIALLVALFATSVTAHGQLSSTQAFTTAPRKVLPMLEETTRLDMIDYFNSNMTNASANAFGGKSRILSLSPEQMTIQLTDASQCQIAVLPDGKQGMIALISTVNSPTPDSHMTVYTSDWSKDVTASTFTKPTLTDWLTPEGKKNSSEVEMSVPFLLISYSYNPDTKTLTLTNNTESFLGKDVYEPLAGYLYKKIDYTFNGKRFNRVK